MTCGPDPANPPILLLETLRPEVTGAWRLGEVRHIVASANQAQCALGFTAEVSFEQGLADFATAALRD